MFFKPACLAVAGLLAVTVLPAAASEDEVLQQVESLHGDAAGFEEAFWLLREAMTYGDPVTVAEMGAYPLQVHANGEVYDVLAPQDLVDNYDMLVAAETQGLVANQELGDLFVNSDGVMFGEGEVWMALVCEDHACARADWRILQINN